MRILLVFMVSLFLSTSCKQEAVLTSGEKVAQEIQTRVGSTTNLTVIARTATTNESDTSLRIDGQFIRVGNGYYNLSQLTYYRYQNFILTLVFP